ncbi:hypothetical protein HPP92_002552 [Vanilla planifolia]|uniref:Uncharacterized protein n=1 Tax=Vanilla planifolia TaxID=51239 RepID=A0A835VMG9_VANPL|nr:hypothetical protein HPP92_002934 [Vanilla planifolia]KAG0502480.1 hypothetical protein HPP92_002552 [Vanilla planifolia]
MVIDVEQVKRRKLRNAVMFMRKSSRLYKRNPSEIVPFGIREGEQAWQARKIKWRAEKLRNRAAGRGEADRVIPNLKPKHLFSGKRSIGKTQEALIYEVCASDLLLSSGHLI